MTSPLEQKIKIIGPVVVTANRVGDGAVIYLRADGGWTTALGEAAVTSDAADARELMHGRRWPTTCVRSAPISRRSG